MGNITPLTSQWYNSHTLQATLRHKLWQAKQPKIKRCVLRLHTGKVVVRVGVPQLEKNLAKFGIIA